MAAAGSHSHSVTSGSSLPDAHRPSTYAAIGRRKSVGLITWTSGGRQSTRGVRRPRRWGGGGAERTAKPVWGASNSLAAHAPSTAAIPGSTRSPPPPATPVPPAGYDGVFGGGGMMSPPRQPPPRPSPTQCGAAADGCATPPRRLGQPLASYTNPVTSSLIPPSRHGLVAQTPHLQLPFQLQPADWSRPLKARGELRLECAQTPDTPPLPPAIFPKAVSCPAVSSPSRGRHAQGCERS